MVTRINGFSGMDIDSMVKSMMASKRVPLDKLNQDKQLLQWKRDSYREMNSKLYEFKSSKLTDKYGKSEALNSYKAVVTGNTDAVKAEALAEANRIDMKITVEQLATNASIETSGLGSGKKSSSTLMLLAAEREAANNGKVFSEMPVVDQEALVKALSDKKYEIKVNGVNFKFTAATSISTMVSTITSNEDAKATATFDEITGKLIISSKTGGATGKIQIGTTTVGEESVIGLFNGMPRTSIETKGAGSGFTQASSLVQMLGADPSKTYTLNLNGKSFSFLGGASIQDVLTSINADPDLNATFDQSTGKLMFKSNIAGGKVKFGDNVGENTLLDLFNYTSGKNAKVTINGTSMEKDSNNFVMNGINLTLLSTTASDKPVMVATQTDSTKVLESIKGFVEDYNSLIKLLNEKTNEIKYRTYTPLTDEQKKEMKDADILAWTQKAQSGLLKNDDIIKSVVSSLRTLVTEKLGDLGTMGITTGKYYENGKLSINESKLTQAIADNPQKIIDLFQGPDSSSSSGLFDKMSDKIGEALELLSERVGTNRFSADTTGTYKEESVMGRSLKRYNSRIDVLQKNLTITENRYYKQFSAMEAAMNKLQSQSSGLISSLTK
ncbi:flagellar filament capping protein FliD [Paenibacillus sp. 22594]|uniref:flagellar filament capping protein FliD n=1 Tax=Paenibacillus sp. 22594 TaxID=3453947 RepID=UPI003F82446C